MTIVSRNLGPKGARWTMTQRPLLKFGLTAKQSRFSYKGRRKERRRIRRVE